MITSTTILIVLATIGFYCVFSRILENSIFSLPMIFTALGLLLGQIGLDLVPMEIGHEVIHLIAEITLILVLFSDASRVKFSSLFAHSAIPTRMLLIGMPLTILLGTLVGNLMSPELPWAVAFLVAAILTPTDAALGQSVVSSSHVPKHISQSVNVESGLNDGLALPVVLIAAILATDITGMTGEHVPENLVRFTLAQVIFGPIAGVAIGFVAAKVLDFAVDRDWATTVSQGLYFLSVAVFAYYGAESFGGNGFIAAFIAGLVFGNTLKGPSMFINEFMEGEGQLLTLLTFLVFGAVLAPLGLQHATVKTVGVAVAFLTLVRMIPIWLALIGAGLSHYEKFFLGWFGPRGLASILFALLVLERFQIPGSEEIVACVVMTVLLSIVLHGVTAAPFSNAFKFKKTQEKA